MESRLKRKVTLLFLSKLMTKIFSTACIKKYFECILIINLILNTILKLFVKRQARNYMHL